MALQVYLGRGRLTLSTRLATTYLGLSAYCSPTSTPTSQIKMAKTAAAYSKKASYFGKKIAQCVQEKGVSVESNRELGNLIREAKAVGVRTDVVDRNIKKAIEKPSDFKELTQVDLK